MSNPNILVAVNIDLHSGHSFHGYGIQNVQSVVDKCEVRLDIKQEGIMFRITLYLNPKSFMNTMGYFIKRKNSPHNTLYLN